MYMDFGSKAVYMYIGQNFVLEILDWVISFFVCLFFVWVISFDSQVGLSVRSTTENLK